jgi:hypothetical protein
MARMNIVNTAREGPRHRVRRILLISLAGLLGLCVLLAVVSTLSNLSLPQPATSEQLTELDKARLGEALQLKSELGDAIWPGWGSAQIPVIVWNDAYEFLVGYDGNPPDGWSPVSGDSFEGRPYFRRTAQDPQNFAVPVGATWAASMATKSATDSFLIDQFRKMFPAPLKQVFPYRFLIQPSETQIGGLLHETFHVYQMEVAPARLQAAEAAHKSGGAYAQLAANFEAAWKTESELLAKALASESTAEKADLVSQFLAQRDSRRSAFHMTGDLADYERWLEWEEGAGKYIELASARYASLTPGYVPLAEMRADPDFKRYRRFDRRWSQEMLQLRYQTTSGEERLYETGMAQAFLLDALMPGWKDQYWQEGVFLEDLLRDAISQH